MIEDAAIVRLFYERSEQAIGELDGKYGKLFHSLAYHILNNRQDAEECVNEAYLGAWNTIPPRQNLTRCGVMFAELSETFL